VQVGCGVLAGLSPVPALRLWEWVAAFLLAVPVALWLAWLLGWL
jgi:hypothetical protein